MIKHVDLLFHKTDEQSPPRSGGYLVYTNCDTIHTLWYSKKHHAWNCTDNDEDPSFEIPYNDTYIVAWADLHMTIAKLKQWRD